jgi:hypothetical protein
MKSFILFNVAEFVDEWQQLAANLPALRESQIITQDSFVSPCHFLEFGKDGTNIVRTPKGSPMEFGFKRSTEYQHVTARSK